MRWILTALLVGLIGMGTTMAAQGDSPQQTYLAEMFSPTGPVEDRFSKTLLAQVPFAQLEQIVAQLGRTIGPVERVEPRGGNNFAIITKTAELPVIVALDAQSKIVGILFRTPVQRADSTADAVDALGSDAAYLVTRNGEPVQSQDADKPLAVGSAFKLGILAVLNDDIKAGRRHWEDVVHLTAADRSLPSGLLQTWPENAPLTLHTAATLMISLSDNTAADLLLRTVGRDAVAAKLGTPALSTREFFVLKSNDKLLQQLVGGDVTGALAAADAATLPDVDVVSKPLQQGAEWYVPLTTLCALLDEVGGLDVFTVNPGVASTAVWPQIAFKGGSETGVLNLSTRVVAPDGTTFCVAATWNSTAALDEAGLTSRYASIFGTLAHNP